jgi:RNA polymerase sigma factor (sigma-70 family)
VGSVATETDPPTDDEDLVKRASAGDRDALSILVTRAQRKGARAAQGQLVRIVRPGIQEHIRRYLAQRCPPSTVASWLEDLTQDAVVRVLLRLADLRGELWPWALVIARNVACQRVRAEIGMQRLKDALRTLSGDQDDPVDPREDSSFTVEYEELAVHVRRACEIVLSELEGEQRQAFALRLEGVAPREIARTLRVNPQSVYNWKLRHRRMVVQRCEALAAKDRAR